MYMEMIMHRLFLPVHKHSCKSLKSMQLNFYSYHWQKHTIRTLQKATGRGWHTIGACEVNRKYKVDIWPRFDLGNAW